REKAYAQCGAALARPILAAAGWARTAVSAASAGTVQMFGYPLALLDRAVRYLSRSSWLQAGEVAVSLARKAGCDVWVIPYVGFEYPLDFPAVVFIHDLVVYHYPEMFDPAFVERLHAIVPARAREAAVCACMSDFICRNDLQGV